MTCIFTHPKTANEAIPSAHGNSQPHTPFWPFALIRYLGGNEECFIPINMGMKNEERKLKGFYNRGYLPHLDGGPIWQSVTFVLKDSLPAVVFENINDKISTLPPVQRQIARYRMIEKYIDSRSDEGLFKSHTFAQVFVDALKRYDNKLYELAAFVVMSNHVHLLFKLKDMELSKVVAVIKFRSSRLINCIRGSSGSMWYFDYFDRYIRNETHWHNVLVYIENNPVKAGLCRVPSEYRFSSAAYRKCLRSPSIGNFGIKW